jgi:hypothetical protein
MNLHPAFAHLADTEPMSLADHLEEVRSSFDSTWSAFAPGGEREIALPNVSTALRSIPGPDDNEVLIRVYKPTSSAPARPAIDPRRGLRVGQCRLRTCQSRAMVRRSRLRRGLSGLAPGTGEPVSGRLGG